MESRTEEISEKSHSGVYVPPEDKLVSRSVSAMEKVFPERVPKIPVKELSALTGETVCAQIAFKRIQGENNFYKLRVSGALAEYVSLSVAGCVPAEVCPTKSDDYYISHRSGLFPDVLEPLAPYCAKGNFVKGAAKENADVLILPFLRWRSVFIEIAVPQNFAAGRYALKFELFGAADGKLYATRRLSVNVVAAAVLQKETFFTDWMHCDCIAETHGAKIFSEAFYKVFARYLDLYVKLGFNALYTPLFTPPLDTEVGAERLTAQLVGVSVSYSQGGCARYEFDFSALKKYVDFALSHGVKYIEFSHLLSQWGGKYAPKIVAEANGRKRKIFGWKTDSTGEEYREFLDSFLCALASFVKRERISEKCVYHITDEPQAEAAERYAMVREIIKKYDRGAVILDASSDFAFYERGLIDRCVVDTDNVPKFFEKGAKDFYAYYACCQTNEYLSNRMVHMPLARVRVLGVQLYASGIKGFLHWGFNFYHSALSVKKIDPYRTTDAGGSFPAGDGFIVYPAKGGAYASMRYAAIRAAVQDYHALYALEDKIGRAAVLKMLEETGVRGFTEYPHNDTWLDTLREKVNGLLAND